MIKSQFNYFSKHWHHLMWSVCKESVAWFSVFLATFSAALAIAPEASATHILLERVSGWVVLVWPPILFVLFIIVISAIKNWPRMYASYHDVRTDTGLM